uniref:SRCR domain-containing protein n=1 Tax=Scleropages formosus TaxID=113540 RepID=A0A8C9VZ46_SCLFO
VQFLFTSLGQFPLRLQGGNRTCSGRVELWYMGSWGTICDDLWDMSDAEVVCRQLGCGSRVGYLATDWRPVLGVSPPPPALRPELPGRLRFPVTPYGTSGSEGVCVDVRLVNGNSPCEGRVEVFHQGQWGTVCDDYWDMKDAAVVCRQMFCGDAVAALGNGHFGEGEGQIWGDLGCSGSESTLKECGQPRVTSGCKHYEDAGVICSAVRLTGGPHPCSGRLEFHHNGSWYTVLCDASWDLRAANVLCQQLGCGSAVAVPGQAWFGEGRGRIWADVFECQGKETHLSRCAVSSWNRAPCSHEHDAGVICNGEECCGHHCTVGEQSQSHLYIEKMFWTLMCVLQGISALGLSLTWSTAVLHTHSSAVPVHVCPYCVPVSTNHLLYSTFINNVVWI